MAAKLFVGNLSFQATEEDLRELFAQAGNVETVRIITDQFTGRPRGFGFVEMATKEEAQKAVEMGASKLQPITTRHTQLSRLNLERVSANVIEAAEQCERLTIPKLITAAPLDDALGTWPRERRLILCDESGAGGPIVDVLAKLDAAQPYAVLTGPEGGFARAELDALHDLPFVTPVGLGPRVLRADTAALAALAILQAVSHDRLKSPPPRFKPIG